MFNWLTSRAHYLVLSNFEELNRLLFAKLINDCVDLSLPVISMSYEWRNGRRMVRVHAGSILIVRRYSFRMFESA